MGRRCVILDLLIVGLNVDLNDCVVYGLSAHVSDIIIEIVHRMSSDSGSDMKQELIIYKNKCIKIIYFDDRISTPVKDVLLAENYTLECC